jgi:hypothetical protein
VSGMMSALTSAVAADTPRSSSITTTCDRDRARPAPRRRSASAYCSRVERSTTCCRLDCRVLRLRDHTLTLAELLTEHTPGTLRRRSGGRCSPRCTGTSTPCSAGTRTRSCWPRPAQAEHLETGCCGLAGNFGFQVSHGEVSGACAERALLPRLPHPDARTRQRRPRSHAPRRAACHGGRPRPSRTNRRPRPPRTAGLLPWPDPPPPWQAPRR